MSDKQENKIRAFDLFNEVIIQDDDRIGSPGHEKYMEPRYNKSIISNDLGKSHTSEFTVPSNEEKYFFSYFYNATMRYSLPAPEHQVQFSVNLAEPDTMAPEVKFIWYKFKDECYVVKYKKEKAARIKKAKKRPTNLLNCPQEF
jgi:hypothetical protein